MGLFSFNLAFQRPADQIWEASKSDIYNMFSGVDGSFTDLKLERAGYGLMSFDPETGMKLPDMAQLISKMLHTYALTAQVVDSDFSVMQLYYDGNMLEESYIGVIYDEFADACPLGIPNLELWKQLLLDEGKTDLLAEALHEEAVFVEDQLRKISELTGIPIMENGLMEALV